MAKIISCGVVGSCSFKVQPVEAGEAIAEVVTPLGEDKTICCSFEKGMEWVNDKIIKFNAMKEFD